MLRFQSFLDFLFFCFSSFQHTSFILWPLHNAAKFTRKIRKSKGFETFQSARKFRRFFFCEKQKWTEKKELKNNSSDVTLIGFIMISTHDCNKMLSKQYHWRTIHWKEYDAKDSFPSMLWGGQRVMNKMKPQAIGKTMLAYSKLQLPT